MPDYEYEYEPAPAPMAEDAIDAESAAAMEVASTIAIQLLDEGRSIHELEEEYNVSLPLVVAPTVTRFVMQLQIAYEFDMPVPCLSREDMPIPVDWLPADRVRAYGWTKSGVLDATAYFRSNYDIVDVSTDDARGFFRRWLGGFIGTAVGGGMQAGLLVRVVTRTHGLRIHYSNTLLFNPHPVFGTTLSTPVDGYLPPGTYMFGVQGTTDPAPRFDNGVFSIPPTTQANLVIA